MTKLAAAALLLLGLPAASHARAAGTVKQYIKFSSSTIDARISFSPGLSVVGAGLKADRAQPPAKELWVQFPPVSTTEAASSSVLIEGDDALPTEMSLTMAIRGAFADARAFPERAYLRYGDGRRWSGWQPFYRVEETSVSVRTSRYFQADLSVPDVDKRGSEDPEKGPSFLGYLQIRLEGASREGEPSLLTGTLIRGSWDTERALSPVKEMR